jgi:hypothetical protein
MGMVEGIFDTVPLEDMPAGYHELRVFAKLQGMGRLQQLDIIRQKIQTYAGIQNISVENINKNNSIRYDLYRDYLKAIYPYHRFEEEKKKKEGTIEDMIEEYKKIFGESKNKETNKNETN